MVLGSHSGIRDSRGPQRDELEMGNMNTSRWCGLVVLAGALVMQGCAQTGDVRGAAPPAPQQVVGPPAVAIPVNDKGQPVVRADTAENFEAIVAAIHQQMQPGGRWEFVDQSERATIDENFADMTKLYNQFGSVDKMDQVARMRLLQDQSTVNAILTKKDGERLVCHEEIRVGTHLPVKTCRTYAQMEAERRGAQNTLRQLGPTMQRGQD